MCAEGGTGSQHSEVIFRSHSPQANGESCLQNPIPRSAIRQRDDAVSSTGPPDPIQTASGEWYAVFPGGCRPYEGDPTTRARYFAASDMAERMAHHPRKRESNINHYHKRGCKPAPDNPSQAISNIQTISRGKLDQRWIFLRNPVKGFHSLGTDGISIKAVPANVSQKESIAAIFRRQQHATFTAETEVNFKPSTAKELAGMTLFQNENHHFVFGKTLISGQTRHHPVAHRQGNRYHRFRHAHRR